MAKKLPPLPGIVDRRQRGIAFVAPKYDFKSGSEGSEVRYSLWGMEALMENIKLLPMAWQDAAGFEVASILAEVIATAKDGLVPFRTGELNSSGGSDDYEPGKDIQITQLYCWFGAPPTGEGSTTQAMNEAESATAGLHTIVPPSEYALIQHEDLTFNHPGGGGPKYLEIPFLAAVPTVIPRIAAAIGNVSQMNPEFLVFALKPPPDA